MQNMNEEWYFCNCNEIVKSVKTSDPNIKCEICNRPMIKESKLKIETFKEIVEKHQFKEINGFVVDVQTANLIVKIHENLSEKNQNKLMSFDILKIVDTCWKLVK